jgi:hypothetical protein
MAANDNVEVVGTSTGWRASYKTYRAFSRDKQEALRELAQHLVEMNVELPEELKRFKDEIGVQQHIKE